MKPAGQLKKEIRVRASAQTSFIVVSAILLLAGVALNAAVQSFKLHFKKEAVQQPRDFHELPQVMGHWMQVSADDKLDKEMEDVLGTLQYCYRDYINIDKVGGDLLVFVAQGLDQPGASTRQSLFDDSMAQIRSQTLAKYNDPDATFDQKVRMIDDALKGKTPTQRKQIAYAIEIMHPASVIHMGLTYYTGLVDTVAHIPDRCYIADGYEPSKYEIPTWSLGPDASGKDQGKMEVRYISFDDSTGTNRVPKCVAYVFHTNGHYESDPLGVRRTLEDLTQRYGYYAKIELMAIGESGDPAVQSAMADFMGASKASIETCLPDWDKFVQTHH
jgi:hypothetical protein